MAAEADSEMKALNAANVDIENYRKLVRTYLNLHVYQAALFWADKVVALTNGKPRDVYWLAQCMFLLKQYHRAAHLLRTRNLDKTYILCNNLTVRCLLEANELNEALKVLNSMDMDVFLQKTTLSTPYLSTFESGMFDDTPRFQVQSSVLLLKGKVLEAMDNRGLASDCYRQALKCDVNCYEAFECLIQHNMLTAAEEEELLISLPLSEQCSKEETDILLLLYRSKLKKYHTPKEIVDNINKTCTQELDAELINTPIITCDSGTPSTISTSIISTPSIPESRLNKNNKADNKPNELKAGTKIEAIDRLLLRRLQDSLDLVCSTAEQMYYNYDYQRCVVVTEKILKQDPYHSACLPIHISCLVELQQSNKLFTLAHNLVDLYPNLAISWFAVGCYYYVIGKSDFARRFLAKSTSLDRLFGPAWLAYGHSFAIENEHDQAMAAYFKASQLMKGCHLPLMYIGLECGLTNNVRLADKFFLQAKNIAPDDPFILHEMAVIAFQNLDYDFAEKQFRDALRIIKSGENSMTPDRWAPLHNNLGHTLRKQKKYDESLSHHHEALVLMPQNASIYSSIAYVHTLMNNLEEAVDWFHRALGLRRDDTFSTTMLNYVIEQLAEEQEPYPGAPNYIPDFAKSEDLTRATVLESIVIEEVDLSIELPNSTSSITKSDVSMSIDMDISDCGTPKH